MEKKKFLDVINNYCFFKDYVDYYNFTKDQIEFLVIDINRNCDILIQSFQERFYDDKITEVVLKEVNKITNISNAAELVDIIVNYQKLGQESIQIVADFIMGKSENISDKLFSINKFLSNQKISEEFLLMPRNKKLLNLIIDGVKYCYFGRKIVLSWRNKYTFNFLTNILKININKDEIKGMGLSAFQYLTFKDKVKELRNCRNGVEIRYNHLTAFVPVVGKEKVDYETNISRKNLYIGDIDVGDFKKDIFLYKISIDLNEWTFNDYLIPSTDYKIEEVLKNGKRFI